MNIRRVSTIVCAAALLFAFACEDSKKPEGDESDDTESKDESKSEDTESKEDSKAGGEERTASTGGDEPADKTDTGEPKSAVAEALEPTTPKLPSFGDLLPNVKGSAGGSGDVAPTSPVASGGGGGCDELAPKVCSTCGSDSAACKGWSEVLDMPTMKTQMAGQCGQLTAAIGQLAAVPQAKAQFCATDPLGVATAAAGGLGEPAESCTKLITAMCDLCGANAAACASFKKVAEMPGALAAMPASSCDMLVEQLPMVAQMQQTKDLFCGTDFLGAAK